LGEPKQRRQLRIILTAAALGEVVEEAPMANVVDAISELPSGVDQWTAIPIENPFRLRPALLLS
jgi:hypothetical protein